MYLCACTCIYVAQGAIHVAVFCAVVCRLDPPVKEVMEIVQVCVFQ